MAYVFNGKIRGKPKGKIVYNKKTCSAFIEYNLLRICKFENFQKGQKYIL